jgi:secernin
MRYLGSITAPRSHQVIFARTATGRYSTASAGVYLPAVDGRQHHQLEYLELPRVSTPLPHWAAPYWCYGFEEGINEHSVVIGNEAVSTKSFRQDCGPCGLEPLRLGLLGMDRCAWHWAQPQRQSAVEVITLLERYGQFGSGVCTPHLAGGTIRSHR